jgi:hypothetical protein
MLAHGPSGSHATRLAEPPTDATDTLTPSGPDPDFAKTCEWYEVEFNRNRPMLKALCKDNRGKKQYSTLNLNSCIKLNNAGQLQCAPGGFVGRSRRGRDLDSAMLEARHGGQGGGRNNNKCTGCEVVSDDTIECSCPIKGGGRVDASYTLGKYEMRVRRH